MAGERVLDALGKLPTDLGMINARVAEIKPTPSEVGPVYREIYKTSKPGARRLATAYATTLPTIDQHRQVFQSVALSRDAEERRTLIKGYRDAHQDQWIVHAIGQLPAAHGRALMKDYVLSPGGPQGQRGAGGGVELRRQAGRRRSASAGSRLPTASRTTTTRSASSSRTSSTRSRRRSRTSSTRSSTPFESLGDAIGAVITWTVDKLTNLAQALLNAGQTIFDILEAAVAYGYDFVRNMIAAIRNVGKAMFTILEQAVHFVGQALRDVLKAIDNLGQQLGAAALLAGDAGRRHGAKGRRGAARASARPSATCSSRRPQAVAGRAPVGRRGAAGARPADRRAAGLRGELHAEPDARHREGADRAGQGGRRHRPGDHQRRRPPAHRGGPRDRRHRQRLRRPVQPHRERRGGARQGRRPRRCCRSAGRSASSSTSSPRSA